MRRGVLILLVGIFMIGVVSAASCDVDNDDQLIMRLYNASNSHVALWNESNDTYLEEICYNDIFGSAYGGADPHKCEDDGSNRVLSLYATGNSHAVTVDTNPDYNEDVCYGNLKCVVDTGSSDDCSNGGKVVARMYSTDNSHVALWNITTDIYTTKICCKASELYWADANRVPMADRIPNIGDRVLAIATDTSSGTFNIREDDVECVLGLPFGCGDDDIRSVVGGDVSGNLIGNWTINQTDLDSAGDLDEFYFNVDGGVDESDRMAINDTIDDSPMNLTVVSPHCGQYFNETEAVTIEIYASDNDSFLWGEVRINENVTKTFVNGGITFNYTFGSSGNYNIVAEAFNEDGERIRHIANVMILGLNGTVYEDGRYVAACIDEPKDLSSLELGVVNFSAESTRAIEVSGGIMTMVSPGTNRLDWYWEFIMPNGRVDIYEFSNNATSLAYRFAVEFPIAGDNSATLRVDFE